MPTDVPIGTILSGYRVVRELGRGAMGVVYLAEDEQLQRAVALKLLPADVSGDERFRSRFLREARLAASLEHSAIVPIYAAGEVEGRLFLAMRYVEGGDLRDLLEREGRLEPDRAAGIVGRIADALDAAHERGLVHRDVKPGNILLDREERSFLADFGLAKHAATVNSLSREGAFSGTIDYIAPEQIQGGEVDGRADVYALACVLFELLAGRPPYHRDTELAVVFAHLSERAPRLSALRPELPEAIDAVLARGLAKDPDDRYQTASELVDELRRAAGGAEVAPPAARGTAQLRTFLIADVRGYTRYTQVHGDEAAAELASTFADVVRGAVAAHHGRLIELRGDEALVVFDSARQALHAALAVQAAVSDRRLPCGVGIGLDAGEAVPVGRGYRGGALNMAARLCSLAGPGEILASETVTHLARAVPGIRFLGGRVERLKGIEHPVRVVEVVPQERAVARLAALNRRMRGRRWPAIVAALALLAVVAVAVARVVTESAHRALSKPHTVAVYDSRGKLLDSVPTGVDSYDLRVGGGYLWSLQAGNQILKIDPRTNRLANPVSVGNVNAYTFGDGAVWIADGDKPDVVRIDAQYGSTSTFKLPTSGLEGGDPHATGIAYGAGAVWASQAGRVVRLSPVNGHVQAIIPTNGESNLTFGDHALYAADSGQGRFIKIDPSSNSIAWQSSLHPWIAGLLAAGGFLWVTVDSDAGVYRFNESNGAQAGFAHTGDGSGAIAYGAGAIWVSNWRAGTISRVNPVSTTVRTFVTGNAPNGLAVAPGGRVFVGIGEHPPDFAASLHGDVAHFVMREDYLDLGDPATAWTQRTFELEYATEARLYNYPDWKGADPAKPVPEIASGPPSVSQSAGVWTYRIPIRTGYRFSPPSSEPVSAETMRFSLERALSPNLRTGYQGTTQPAPLFLTNLVGEDAYRAGKAAHVSGLSVDGPTLVLRTTGPVPDLVERLALPFFSAEPIGTPTGHVDLQSHPIPTAGPYYIAYQNTGWQTVLKRNPNYHGPRPQRLDAVIYEVGIDTGRAATRVEKGTLDYESESDPDFGVLAPGGDIARRFSSPHQQAGRPWYTNMPFPGLRWLNMNTSRGLLADHDARLAVNLALDRPALAANDGGIPADTYLPPPMLRAASDRHLFPIGHPTDADISRAKRLLHGRTGRLVLITCTRAECVQQAAVIRGDLARIGLEIVVRRYNDQYSEPAPGTGDMRMDNWFTDEYDPSNVLDFTLFTDDPMANPYGFHSPRWQRADRAAGRLSGAARWSAFAKVALGVGRTDTPWAVYEQVGQPAFFSARLGCIQYPPAIGGIDIAGLCIND